ncbi:cyclic nucleotide-binding protein [Nitzschia inconspicua]|uniref:Cyclic nucleotide-binding protein n=1 Tax=Nitzschia inconspicua TaxID=303405 RepID=A0A9K3M3H8_9STRA|nr:cyclic nucleotide-binding protein [Nitzschia inconspicua]
MKLRIFSMRQRQSSWDTRIQGLVSNSALTSLTICISFLLLFLVPSVYGQGSNNNITTDDQFLVNNDGDLDDVDDVDDAVVDPVEIVNCSGCRATDAILYPWMVQLMGCVTLFLVTRFNIPLPYAAIMFILGAIMGAVSSLSKANNILTNSITQWTNIDSDLLLLVFLPGLIFKDAVTIPIHLFVVASLQIWLLAFPMVLVGTTLTAVVGYYVLPYQWPLPAAATLGAILASTDPIAVASVLKTSGASPRLVIQISGESLLNDGSSFVFFTIFSQLFYINMGIADEDSPDKITVWDGLLVFVRMSIGGTCVGAGFGAALLLIIWELDRRLEREFDILQVVFGLTAAYLCYFICDQILSMSGVVAVVTYGVIVNHFGRGMINDKKLMESYLVLAEYLLNTLLFTLGGTIWATISFETIESYQIQGVDCAWLLVLYLLVLFIRFIQVGIFYPIVSRIGLKSDWREAVFLAYGGLRGAVGVALGLSLVRHVFEKTDDFQIRKLATILQFMGGGVTLLTLSINGTSAGPMLKMLGLAKPSISTERVKLLFEGMAMDFVYEQISQLYEESRFLHVNFEVLKKQVPFVTKEPTKRHGQGVDLNSYSVQRFNRQDSGCAHYLQVTGLSNRASTFAAEGNEEHEGEILLEVRQIFLELLGEAYKVLLDLGELDMQEDNGYIYDTLQASVNLARNEVEHNQSTIQDWKWTEKFIFGTPTLNSAQKEESDEIHTQQRDSVASWASSNMQVGNSAVPAVRDRSAARRLRLDVLRTIAFQQGHKMARSKLELFINRIDIPDDGSVRETIRPALEKVKEESKEQVKEAQEMLEKEISKIDLEIILSHYCSRIIIHRLMKFIERTAEDGTLGKIEARKYLSDMDNRLRQIVEETMDQLVTGGGCDPPSDQVSRDDVIAEDEAEHLFEGDESNSVDGSQC